ncbi:Dyp-type peroxidase [Actinoplanes sp. GCM10030250]
MTTAPGDHAVFAAFDVGDEPAPAVARLVERVAAVAASGTAEVTVGVGASFFDGRVAPAAERPRLLTAMTAFPNDVLDGAWCHGDVLLQVGGSSVDVLDQVVRRLGEGLRARWRLAGFRAENTRTRAGLASARNLFGFREGSGNPDPRDTELMDDLVWAGRGSGEPAWALGGTYQVVRLIRFAVQLWNRDAPARQEEIIGRRRDDGAPLAGGAEDDTFDFQSDPDGAMTPLDSHIRRADPRTADSKAHRILRRGFSYRRDDADQGLVFVCFQRDPEAGFAATQRRLAGEALDRYVLPFGGGYWFVPPSVAVLNDLLAG